MHHPVKATLKGHLEHREGAFLNLGGLMISVGNAPAQLAVGDQVTVEAEYFEGRGWTGSVTFVAASSPNTASQGRAVAPAGSRLQRFGSATRVAPAAAASAAAKAPAQAPSQAPTSSNPSSSQGAAPRTSSPALSRAQRYGGRSVAQEPQPAANSPAGTTTAGQRPRFDPQHPQDGKVKF